jgi:hypothetical protein
MVLVSGAWPACWRTAILIARSRDGHVDHESRTGIEVIAQRRVPSFLPPGWVTDHSGPCILLVHGIPFPWDAPGAALDYGAACMTGWTHPAPAHPHPCCLLVQHPGAAARNTTPGADDAGCPKPGCCDRAAARPLHACKVPPSPSITAPTGLQPASLWARMLAR